MDGARGDAGYPRRPGSNGQLPSTCTFDLRAVHTAAGGNYRWLSPIVVIVIARAPDRSYVDEIRRQ